ncbi:MAG: ABC transporter substrate-binding protein, partial [Anaerovoracaceae bacterium]|nr:ABC transporter substrate-binding protein [Anaerovoracaceae bacterium]
MRTKTSFRKTALVILLCLATAVSVIGLTGCGSDDVANDAETLVYGSGDYTAINPALYEHGEINLLLFAGLTAHDENDNVVPGLAKSWSWDDSTKTYTFNLRKNLKFHDGEPLTSADVKFTLEAILDEDNQSEIATNYQDIRKISCPNDETV